MKRNPHLVVGILATAAAGLVVPATGAKAAAPVCAQTGLDPTKTPIHLNKKGTVKKLKKPENPGKLFPGRPDTQKEDQERNPGEIVRVSGYSTTVVGVERVQTLSVIEEAGYLKVVVKVCNRDGDAQPYNLLDWRLQTPSGQVVDPAFVSVPSLEFGDLVKGGEVTGDVYFEVAGETGEFYVLYKPDSFDASRGIWKAAA